MAAKKMKREGKGVVNEKKFMTESYRQKLEESKAFEKLDKLQEEYDKKNSAKARVS